MPILTAPAAPHHAPPWTAALALLLSVSVAAVGVTAQEAADISAVTSWTSADGGPVVQAGGGILSIPRTVTSGVVEDFYELLPSNDVNGNRVRVRSAAGRVLFGSASDVIGDCPSPTGVARTGRAGPEMVAFCGGTGRMIVISSEGDTITVDAPFAGEEFNRGQFVRAGVASPTPLAYALDNAGGESVVIALYNSGERRCVGGFRPSQSFQDTVFSSCARTEITDFYFSSAPVASPQAVFLILELGGSPQVTQTTLVGYNLTSFSGMDESPFTLASWTFILDLAQTQSPIVRSNVNDMISGVPLIAYAQASSGDVVAAVVRVINPLVGSEATDMQRQITTGDMPVGNRALHVMEVAFISYTNAAWLIIQTTAGAFGSPLDNTAMTPLTATWKFPGLMVPGMLLLPLRDLTARATEGHRHQYSPAYSTYNPYHIIVATGVVFAMPQSSDLRVYSFASIADEPVAISMAFIQECLNTDRFVAMTSFNPQLTYAGCQVSAAYGLVNLQSNTVQYSMIFPVVRTAGTPAVAPQRVPFGYLSAGSHVTFLSGSGSSGVAISPLPRVAIMRRPPSITTAALYHEGAVYIVSSDDTNVILSRYVASTPAMGDTSPWAATRTVVVAPMSGNTRRTARMALYGTAKEFIAVGAVPGEVHLYQRDTLNAISESAITLNVEDCAPGNDPGELLDMHTEMYDQTTTNRFSVLGSSTKCVFRISDRHQISTWRRELYSTGNERVSSTLDYCVVYMPTERIVTVHPYIFQPIQGAPQTFQGFDAYRIGTNVIITFTNAARRLACLGLRTSAVSWEYIVSDLAGSVVAMEYYNNTLYLVDTAAFYQFDVANDAPRRQLTRTAFPTAGGATPIIAATVDAGMIIAVSATRLLVYDAVTWRIIVNTRLIRPLPTGTVELLVHTATTAGGNAASETGQYLVEVRARVAPSGATGERREGALYRADTWTSVTGLGGRPSLLEGPTASMGMYVVFDSTDPAGTLGGFAALGLPSDVQAPQQVRRPVRPIEDVLVPDEVTPAPTPEPFPRGDIYMAGSPPMSFFLRAEGAVLRDNLDSVAYATETLANGRYTLVIHCVPVADPSASSRCNISPAPASTSPIAPTISLLQVSSKAFAVITGSYLQFFSWTTGTATGSQFPLSGRSRGIPPYVSVPEDDLFVVHDGSFVTAINPASSTGEVWSRPAPRCRVLKLLPGGFLMCDVGAFYVYTYPAGEMVIDSSSSEMNILNCAATRLSSGVFLAVSAMSGAYIVFTVSSTGDSIDRAVIYGVLQAAGAVLAVLPGWTSAPDSVVILFENQVAFVSNITSAAPNLQWSASLRGMVGQRGALAFVADGSTLIVGTDTGILMLDSTGYMFGNTSMRRTYVEDAGEVQPLRIVALGSGTNQYAIMWNGHIAVINLTGSSSQALFSYGSGSTRATCLGYATDRVYLSDGRGGGIVPLNTTFWGSNINRAVSTADVSGTNYVVGWDGSNITEGVNLASLSWMTDKTVVNVRGETSIVDSVQASYWGMFFGTTTMTLLGLSLGTGASVPVSTECARPLTFKGASVEPANTGRTVVWYSSASRDCLYVYTNSAPSPRFVGALSGKYQMVAVVPYARQYATLTSTELVFYDSSDVASEPYRLTNAQYMSIVSSPTAQRGIAVVISGAPPAAYRVSVIQTDNSMLAWSVNISSVSTAPVTYYNDSLYLSTESGVARMTLSELTYPCGPRIMFETSQPQNSRDPYHSQVTINTLYSIGYATSRGVFYAFDAAVGAVMWERGDLDAVRDVLVLEEGTVIAASSRTQGVVLLNAFTGATLLTLPTQTTAFSKIFLGADGKTLTVTNMMTTTIDLENYRSYFASVTVSRPKAEETRDFVPYSYRPGITPPSCDAPPSNVNGEPLFFQTPPAWVSSSGFGFTDSTTTGFYQRPSDATGIAVTLRGSSVLGAQMVKGSYKEVFRQTVASASCTNAFFAGIASLERSPYYFGVTCGSVTTFFTYDSSDAGRDVSVVVKPGPVLTDASGVSMYFVNGGGTFDALSLRNLQRPSGFTSSVSCAGTTNALFLVGSRNRAVMACSGTGVVGIDLTTGQAVATITSPSGARDFSTVDIDVENNVGVACRGGSGNQPNAEMVMFTLDRFTAARTPVSHRSASGVCGIRLVDGAAYAVFAFDNGAESYSVRAPTAEPVKTTYSGSACGMSTVGVVFGSGIDLFFTAFGGQSSTLIANRTRSRMGSCVSLRNPSSLRATISIVSFGSNYIVSANTSLTADLTQWLGTDTSFAPRAGAMMWPSHPYLYMTTSTGQLAALNAEKVAFAASSLVGGMRLAVSLYMGTPYVYFSQMGSLACIDPDGTILWNYLLNEGALTDLPFAPIIVDDSNYLIASGGGQSVAYVNRFTGVIVGVTSFPASCAVTFPSTSSVSFTNRTTVYLALEGWSCVHVLDLTVSENAESTHTLPPIQVIEYAGNGRQPLEPGFPRHARVGPRDLFLLAYPTPAVATNLTFAVFRAGVALPLWAGSLTVTRSAISTYGYFLFTADGFTLNVYDLLTGRYVWGLYLESAVAAPVLGFVPYLYVVTLQRIHMLLFTLNTPTFSRNVSFMNLPNSQQSVPSSSSFTLTNYGLILYSTPSGSIAYRIRLNKLEETWTTDRYMYRLSSFLEDSKALLLSATDRGNGVLDMSTGVVTTFGTAASNLDISGSDVNGFTCSFFATLGACRRLSNEIITPTSSLDRVPIPEEPTDITPTNWTPWYPDGSGGDGSGNLQPTPECLARLQAVYGTFMACMNHEIRELYHNGRSTVLECPVGRTLGACYSSFADLSSLCLDVMAALNIFFSQENHNPASPLGLCDSEEALARCSTNTSDDWRIFQSCMLVEFSSYYPGVTSFRLPANYSLGYVLTPLTFAPIPKNVNVGAIVGGIIAGLVVVAIASVVVVLYVRRQRKQRDMRFFDEPIADDDKRAPSLEEPMLSVKDSHSKRSDESTEVPMKDMASQQSRSISGSVVSGVAPAALPLREAEAPQRTPVKMLVKGPAKSFPKGKAPVKTPPKQPVALIDDDL